MGTQLDIDRATDAGLLATEPAGAVSAQLLPAESDEVVAALRARLPWIDSGTAALLVGVTHDLASAHQEVVAVILFGSLARHEERPLGTAHPSDADVLVLVRQAPATTAMPMLVPEPEVRARVPLEHKLALYRTIGEREYRHPDSALSVQAVLAAETMLNWDDRFVENVARDGVLLWARSSLPAALASVVTRGAVLTPLPPPAQ